MAALRTLHVVTHPESRHHVEGRVGGWHDSELTPDGLRAAGRIARTLRERVPAGAVVEVVSSSLWRTLQTAEPVAALLGVPVRPDPDLREKSYGAAEGRPQAWLDERFVAPPADGDRLHHDEGLPGAETRGDLGGRVYAALDRLLARGADHQVVVTHGFAATYVVAGWIGMPLEATGRVSFPVPSGSITTLREDDVFHNRAVVALGEVPA